MMEKLEHVALQEITLPNHSVHWYKKDKEISINSTLFDVHSYAVKKDSTTFRGLYDHKEAALKNQVKKLLDQKDQTSSSDDLFLAKLLFQLWVDQANRKDLTVNISSLKIIKHRATPGKLLWIDISIPFPPPKILCSLKII